MNRGALFAAGVILIGLLLLLKSMFNWNISVGRVAVGILVILVGVTLLTGGFHKPQYNGSAPHTVSGVGEENSVVFGTRVYEAKTPGKYNVIFGSGVIDLRAIEYQSGQAVEVNVIFGESEIRIKSGMTANIHSSVAFAEVRHPGSSGTTWLGDQSSTHGQGENALNIQVNCVFGSTRIIEME